VRRLHQAIPKLEPKGLDNVDGAASALVHRSADERRGALRATAGGLASHRGNVASDR